LSRDGIVATAVGILRTDGLSKVTMRRLARELDTGPASLYVYVANTDELHAAMLDHFLGEVDLDASGSDWRERLVGVLTSYTSVLYANPELSRSALAVWPSGEHYVRLVERLLQLLDEGEVPPQQAAWGVDVLLQFPLTVAVEGAIRDQSPHNETGYNTLSQALREADQRTYPHVHAQADRLVSGTPEKRLAWHFHMLIEGITHTPVP
jgi:AcrR family transcriptional regulator